jgi:thiamine biosynthesis lipoprotein
VRHEASRISMACTYTIVAYGPSGPEVPAILEAALDEVDRIDRLMSHYKKDSPLSRLNREASAGPVAVDSELFDFLGVCQRYSRDSGGAFDVTVGPLMKAWGFFAGDGRVPTERDLKDARARTGYRHVLLDPVSRTVRFDRPGVELDLGGIAKGYAVDRVVSLLRPRGVTAALVSAGGSTLFGLGAPPGAAGWQVDVDDPVDPHKTALSVVLKDRALSVSGSSEKAFIVSGRRYTHVMDPRSGRPVEDILSVAVLADSGVAGDVLDNAFFVLGVEGSKKYLRRLANTEAVFFLPRRNGGWRMVRLRNAVD